MTDLPVIKHIFRAGLWKPAYSLTWDWDNCKWIESLEPERGEALTWNDIICSKISKLGENT